MDYKVIIIHTENGILSGEDDHDNYIDGTSDDDNNIHHQVGSFLLCYYHWLKLGPP